jgi:hypothetical protein
MTPLNPPALVADPTDDECPGCGAIVQVWGRAGRAGCRGRTQQLSTPALSTIGLLPTPELRTAAFLTVLRTEVARHSAKKEHTR